MRVVWPCVAIIFCLGLLMGTQQARAQDLVLTLTNTPDPILLGSNITYNLSVSNATGFGLLPGAITNEYSSNAEFVRATNRSGVITISPGLIVFPIDGFEADEVVHVLLELRGTNVGLLTNRFTVFIDDAGLTPLESTNVVSSIELPLEADLGISILGPANGVFPGDHFSYSLLATNSGPDEALGVVVTNLFPTNVSLVGLSPSDSVVVTNGFVLFSVGTLTNRGSATATVSVLATNAAVTNLITAGISAPAVSDTNTSNNSFTTNVPILTPVLGQVLVTNLSGQMLNPQTSWIEQRMVLSNRGPDRVESVRLLVDSLPSHLVRLVNATGTNGSTPYAAHGGGLETNATVELILEYYSPTRSTNGPNPTWSAYGTPKLDLTPQAGSGITVDRLMQIDSANLNNGRILLEWSATAGASYQVIYDEQVSFDTAKGSLPSVATPVDANRIQWLDYGPPRTLAAPVNSTSRFYRVIQLP